VPTNPYLKIIQGPNPGAEIHISGDALVLGRDSSSDYAIPNDRISRRHMRIFLKDLHWMVEDLGSKNHTRLNNKEIEPGQTFVLADEDYIQLATQVVLSFHDPAKTISETSFRVMTDALWLDTANSDVFINKKRLNPKLSKRLFAILAFLYKKSQTEYPVASFEEISAVGWAGEYGISFNMLDAEIHRLRDRLKELEDKHLFIETIKGQGRKFVQKKLI